MRADRDEASWLQHVRVGLRLGPRVFIGAAPVADPDRYEPGQEVDVLYDPGRPERIRLDEERYDAGSPGLFWSAILVAGFLPVAMGWWWTRRLRRVAASRGPAFAMRAIVADDRPHWWNLRRPWVTLLPLDSPPGGAPAQPVGAYPLMAAVPVVIDAGRPTEVKGQVRDGGLVVARAEPIILWPRGRLRT